MDVDRKRALRAGCRIFQQFEKVRTLEADGKNHGQNVEALRVALLKLAGAFPEDFLKELSQMLDLDYVIGDSAENEAAKP